MATFNSKMLSSHRKYCVDTGLKMQIWIKIKVKFQINQLTRILNCCTRSVCFSIILRRSYGCIGIHNGVGIWVSDLSSFTSGRLATDNAAVRVI